jgi:hypothetical protein
VFLFVSITAPSGLVSIGQQQLMFMLLVTMHPPLHFVLALISIVLLD